VYSTASRVIVLCLCSLWMTTASAFQVLPKVSDVDRKLTAFGSNGTLDSAGQYFVTKGIPLLKSPVHEAITLRAIGCNASDGEERNCVTEENVLANRIFLYGVRWPDDPPFALSRKSPPRISGCDVAVTLRSTAQPWCWRGLFDDAGKKAKQHTGNTPAFGPGDMLLYRSHYGDLQFFHSMAAKDGEIAADTKRRMKMWAQFLWGIATKTLPTDKFLRDLGITEFGKYFPGDMSATNLLATGIPAVRKDLDKVAIGALLHMVQDSFSYAHTSRRESLGGQCPSLPRFDQPGRIEQFYSYAQQVGHAHDNEDTFDALSLQTIQTSPTVVDVSRGFLTLWQEGAPWQIADAYFECVFDLEDPNTAAGPGPFTE
jgi:hypothetical protein